MNASRFSRSLWFVLWSGTAFAGLLTVSLRAVNHNPPAWIGKVGQWPGITVTATLAPAEGVPGTSIALNWSAGGAEDGSGAYFKKDSGKTDSQWVSTHYDECNFIPDSYFMNQVIPASAAYGSSYFSSLTVTGTLYITVAGQRFSKSITASINVSPSVTVQGQGPLTHHTNTPPDPSSGGGGNGNGGTQQPDHALNVYPYVNNVDKLDPVFAPPTAHTSMQESEIDWDGFPDSLYVMYDTISANLAQPGFAPFNNPPFPSDATSVTWMDYGTYLKTTYDGAVSGPLSSPFQQHSSGEYVIGSIDMKYHSIINDFGDLSAGWTELLPPSLSQTTQIMRWTLAVNSATPTHAYTATATLSQPYTVTQFITAFPQFVTTISRHCR